ncbi:MAG: DUF362 domain-containing protein [Acidobacteria bacterium]|nr:DUF362 domain-containing protein [Acidobacteriota bacterium]
MTHIRRRDLLGVCGGAWLAGSARGAAAARVSVVRCPSYSGDVLAAVGGLFDQLGGVDRLAAGKTVAIKIDMSGSVRARNGFTPAWFTHWTHPAVIAAVAHHLSKAGAKRIRILESSQENDHPLEDNFLLGGWDPDQILKAAPNVEMENTGAMGGAHSYARLNVAGGGLIYPGFDFNHSYAECDVMVSLAKMKQSPDTGVALTMKNMLNAAPGTIYGDAAGFDGPSAKPFGALSMFRIGNRQPSSGSPPERDPESSRDPGYRLPRVNVDILRARPVHLAIVDGVETQTELEAPAEEGSALAPAHVRPGVLMAGFSPVSTDAIAMQAMGFDPMARRGQDPFLTCDNTLELAEAAGLGVRDPGKIEVAGARVDTIRFPFRGRR